MKIPKVTKNCSIQESIEEINEHGLGIVFIVDEDDKLSGVATDGDIRRGILNGISLDSTISKVMTKDPIKIYDNWDQKRIDKYLSSIDLKNKIPKHKDLLAPILNNKDRIIDIKSLRNEDIKSKNFTLKEPRDNHNLSKVLVIGGAGYVGSVLVRELLDQGYYVKVMDTLMYGDKGINDLYGEDNFEFIDGDITNIKDSIDAIKDVDAVINLAAVVGDPASRIKSRETLEINYFSTRILGEVARYLGIHRFIFASTCSVYGYGEDLLTEQGETNPLSLYAETKLESEDALLDLEDNSFSPTVLRFGTAYGVSPRMRFDLVANLLAAKAVQDNEITVYGEGSQYRPFVHIKDMSKAIIKVLESPHEKVSGEIFNVGSNDQNLKIDELAKIVKDQVSEAELKYIEEKEDERSYKVSFNKIKNQLGYETEYKIKDMVENIKTEFKNGRFRDYTKKEYSNYKSLESNQSESKWPD